MNIFRVQPKYFIKKHLGHKGSVSTVLKLVFGFYRMPFASPYLSHLVIIDVYNLSVFIYITKDTYRYGVRARRPVMVRLLVLASILFAGAEL